MQKVIWGSLMVMVLAGAYFRDVIYNEFKVLKLVPLPETFTELYFTDPTKLPSVAVVGKPLSFSFSIRNKEGKDMQYTYRVFVSANSTELPVDTGGAHVRDSESEVIQERYIPTRILANAQMRIELVGRTERIDFLLK